MHPGTGDQVNRCFLSQKEPEEPARKGHGEVAELCEAAGDLLLYRASSPSSLSVCRNPGSFVINF